MKKYHLPLFLALLASSLFSACQCLPLVDQVSKKAAAVIAPEPPQDPHVPQVIFDQKDTKDNKLHTHSGYSPMYNNIYVGTTYSSGTGNLGQIQVVFDSGSQTPVVQWYRNGALIGTVPSTATNLQLVQHQVRFYDTSDGTWFPAAAIPVSLTSAKKKAVLVIKVQ